MLCGYQKGVGIILRRGGSDPSALYGDGPSNAVNQYNLDWEILLWSINKINQNNLYQEVLVGSFNTTNHYNLYREILVCSESI